MVIPRSRSSGALSIVSKARYSAAALQREVLGDGRRQARLAMVDMADRPDVDVRLGAIELLLRHVERPTPKLGGEAADTPALGAGDGSIEDRSPCRGGGAHNRTRTDDLFLTKEVLCQLSYVGPVPSVRAGGVWWAGRELNPHSRRRLIYSQRSSPPAQPTHEAYGGRATLRHRGDPGRSGFLLLEPTTGLEPGTCGLQNRCSTN